MNTRDKIEELLKESESGLTTREIAVKIGEDESWMMKTLERMWYKDRIRTEKVNGKKTWFIN